MNYLTFIFVVMGCVESSIDLKDPLPINKNVDDGNKEKDSEVNCGLNMYFNSELSRCMFKRPAVISTFSQSEYYSSTQLGTPQTINFSLEAYNVHTCSIFTTSDGKKKTLKTLISDDVNKGEIYLSEMDVEISADSKFSLNCEGDYGSVSEEKFFYYKESLDSKIEYLEKFKRLLIIR